MQRDRLPDDLPVWMRAFANYCDHTIVTSSSAVHAHEAMHLCRQHLCEPHNFQRFDRAERDLVNHTIFLSQELGCALPEAYRDAVGTLVVSISALPAVHLTFG